MMSLKTRRLCAATLMVYAVANYPARPSAPPPAGASARQRVRPAAESPAPGALTTLPPRATDLSIRFLHAEPRVTARSLAAYWAFDEGSGYEFRDGTGADRTAHVIGDGWNTTGSGLTRSLHREGRRAGCVYLDGTRWLEARGAPLGIARTNRVSVSAWIKPDAAPPGGVSLLRDTRTGFDLRVGAAGELRFAVDGRDRQARTVASRPGVIAPGKWSHVAAACDATRGECRVYTNGALAGAERADAFALGETATSHVVIGRGLSSAESFTGRIDEVTIHSDALGEDAVRGLYVAGLPKTYAQTRETIDADRGVWTRYHGNRPVPHPVEPDTVFHLSYNRTLDSHAGIRPVSADPLDAADRLTAARFGGGLLAQGDDRNLAALAYPSPVTTDEGTLEMWFIPTTDSRDPARRSGKTLLRLEGAEHTLELRSGDGRWAVALERRGTPPVTAASAPAPFVDGEPVHLGATWQTRDGAPRLALYVNGVEAARAAPRRAAAPLKFDRSILVGGEGAGAAHGIIDDLRISNRVRRAEDICPRGHTETEAAALDVKDDFGRLPAEPLMLWRSHGGDWRYSVKSWEDDGTALGDSGESRPSIEQRDPIGLRALSHPDARGRMSSAEAGVAFDRFTDGWAGVYVRSPSGEPAAPDSFSGYTFAVNPLAGRMRLAVHARGRVTTTKTLPYDFAFRPRKTYTLTLTSAGDGELRGYVDHQNMISLRLTNDAAGREGFAGLFTENTRAHFDDFHFTALTPARRESRLIQRRFFSDGAGAGARFVYGDASLNAFRWKKRQGLPPWQRTYKNPQPPGAIFGAADGVARPNPPRSWRAEDSANSAVVGVDGMVYYFLRGNPRADGRHGPAQLGALTKPSDEFDGLHFADESEVLRGHDDRVPDECRDGAPGTHRHRQLQINDEGAAYVGAGKIIVVAREFRNVVKDYPRFSRLVYGTYDVTKRAWDSEVVKTVAWSSQSDPASCRSRMSGLNATPEIVALRDAATDEYDIFLYHLSRPGFEGSAALVSGLRYDGTNLVLNGKLPQREMLAGYPAPVYGQRVLFDNGIYYLNFNAATTAVKLRQDWPDRYALASSLHPYASEWIESMDGADSPRPYFARGGEFDFDNAAIWQGAMFKHRGRYYMYFENFHAIEDRDEPYQHYDHIQAGSRVGYATAN